MNSLESVKRKSANTAPLHRRRDEDLQRRFADTAQRPMAEAETATMLFDLAANSTLAPAPVSPYAANC